MKVQVFKSVKKAADSVYQTLSNTKKAHHEFVLLAGTGMSGTRDTIELTKKAEDLGYNAAMV